MLEELPGILTALDEPMADASIVPTHLLSGFAREHVKVALGGDGGDELFLGYPTFQAHRMAGWIDWVPRFLISGVMEPLASLLPVSTSNLSLDYRIRRFLRGLRHGPIERHFAWIGGMDPLAQAGLFTEAWAEGIDFSNLFSDVHGHLSAVTGRDAYDRLSYVYSKLYMGDDILVKVDRASMAHSLEVRSPLLDPGVVSLATALPTRFKMQGMEMKRVLKHMLKSRLPPGIVERPKKGFGVPIAEWLKGPLRPLMEDLLGSDRIRREGIFRPEAVQALVRDHLQGRADHRKPLWSLIVFQLWREHHAPDSFLSV
jgi:asparagine synthase (glutamine-hydrolysing)